METTLVQRSRSALKLTLSSVYTNSLTDKSTINNTIQLKQYSLQYVHIAGQAFFRQKFWPLLLITFCALFLFTEEPKKL